LGRFPSTDLCVQCQCLPLLVFVKYWVRRSALRVYNLKSKMPADPLFEANYDDVRRYGLAIVAAVAALLLRGLLAPLLGENDPYHTVWAAVVFSAWYCGLGPSIVCTLIGVFGVWYWFLPPGESFKLDDPKTAISGMLGFLFFSGLIIALGETNRRSLAKRKRAEAELRIAHDDLERKVAERTADLNLAKESLGELSSRLQQMRDEERRRIARELHDSVGQLLAALSMNIAVVRLQSDRLDEAGARAVSENAAMVDQITREIRTISHLLHPPLLEVAGLASALRWYVDGFSERSQIKVDLRMPEDFARLPDEMEIAIFRVVQECLTNVHRHSGSATAEIRLYQDAQRLLIEVQDRGKGIPGEKQRELNSVGRSGVGFRGMRERLRQLGGTLRIQSDGGGTVVIAMLPLEKAAPAKSLVESGAGGIASV
jgi:signal transduction histidine kinase